MFDMIQHRAPELAFHTGTTALACFVIHQAYPAPSAPVLLVIGAVASCAGVIIRELAPQLSEKIYHSHDAKFNPAMNIICATGPLISTIFVRYVAQCLGCQVPGFLQTLGYLYLAESVTWITKSAVDIGSLYYRDKHAF